MTRFIFLTHCFATWILQVFEIGTLEYEKYCYNNLSWSTSEPWINKWSILRIKRSFIYVKNIFYIYSMSLHLKAFSLNYTIKAIFIWFNWLNNVKNAWNIVLHTYQENTASQYQSFVFMINGNSQKANDNIFYVFIRRINNNICLRYYLK